MYIYTYTCVCVCYYDNYQTMNWSYPQYSLLYLSFSSLKCGAAACNARPARCTAAKTTVRSWRRAKEACCKASPEGKRELNFWGKRNDWLFKVGGVLERLESEIIKKWKFKWDISDVEAKISISSFWILRPHFDPSTVLKYDVASILSSTAIPRICIQLYPYYKTMSLPASSKSYMFFFRNPCTNIHLHIMSSCPDTKQLGLEGLRGHPNFPKIFSNSLI